MSSNQRGLAIRVCFIAPKAYPLFNPGVEGVFGGAEVDLYLLATELAKDENYDVSFITADYGQAEIETIENVRIVKSLSLKKNPLIGAIKIWQAMKKAKAQLYFQEAPSLGVFLTALFCKLSNKIFIYRTASQGECDGTYLKQHFVIGKFFRWALKNASQVIVQNEIHKESIKLVMQIDPLAIPNAHHIPPLSDSSKNSILWVGRSDKLKRPGLFLDLAEQFPHEKFIMICQRATGDKNYESLVAHAETIKNLEFIKRVEFDKIDRYFQRAKVFVSTSDSEGFPNTFIQSCKTATPILSLCVNSDNFLDRFKCGMCANGNWNAFLQQLKELLLPEKQLEYGRNARSYVEQKHDIKKIAEIYGQLFRNLNKTI